MSLRPSAKTEVRRNWYMVDVDVDADEGREDNMVVETPRNKMRKRRRERRERPTRDDEDLTAVSMAAMQLVQNFSSSISSENRLHLESLAQMVAGVMSDDRNLQFEMMTGLRKLLSKGSNLPINEVVQSGVVPRIVQFLSGDDFPQLQFEAAWALTNIASGTSENTKVIIDSGAVPLLVKLVSSADEDVREQAVWTLGNIVGDSPQCRDFVLSHGAMLSLLAQFNDNAKLSMLKTATWTLSNFCRGKPHPAVEQTLPALPVLERLLHSIDEDVLVDACWALSHLSDGMNYKIQTVIDSGVISRLIELLAHPSPSVLIPALRTIGNIVTGDDMQKQILLSYHLLPGLLNLLTNTNYKKSIKQNTCRTISKITAGNTSQIQEVIQSGIIPPLIHLLQQGEFDIKKEAAWAISNATSGGNHDQIKFLVSQGCIKPLCDLLSCPDPRIVTMCLKGLENILEVGEAEKNKNVGNAGDYNNPNLYAQMIDEAEGLEKIENLQSHDNDEIYDNAVQILDAFWPEDDEVCDDVGQVSESNAFQFGSQNGAAAPVGGLLKFFQRFFVSFRT